MYICLLYTSVGDCTIEESQTEDVDWVNNWKQYFHQFYIDDILVIPSWENVEAKDSDKMVIHIDPGTAFGTGMHETTQLCICLLYTSERYKNVTVEEITPDEFDHAATRDKGIRQSDADIVICMTQDACPDNEYLVSELVQALEEANVAVAYARQLPRKESTLLERYTRQFNYPPESKVKSSKDLERMGIKTFFCSDVCAAYNRDMYLKNGGFEKKAIFNEDMIYAAKVIENEQKVYYLSLIHI